MKKFVKGILASALLAVTVFTSLPVSAYATVMPESSAADGRIAVASSEVFYNTATPDSILLLARSNYRVTASTVRMYTWGANEEFSHGTVWATAPRFNARAEVWRSGSRIAAGTNQPNAPGRDYSSASSTATSRNSSNTPRIFYNW